MPSPSYEAFRKDVETRRGGRTQAVFADSLNREGPPDRKILSGYISSAEAATRNKQGALACPVWFVEWYCKKFGLQIPDEYKDRQTKESGVRKPRLKNPSLSPTPYPDSAQTAILEKQNRDQADTIRRLHAQIAGLKMTIEELPKTGLPMDLYTADWMFVSTLCGAVEKEAKELRKGARPMEAEQLRRILDAIVSQITALMERLQVTPRKKTA